MAKGTELTPGYFGGTDCVVYAVSGVSEMIPHHTTRMSQKTRSGTIKIGFGPFSGEIFKSTVRMKASSNPQNKHTEVIFEIKKRGSWEQARLPAWSCRLAPANSTLWASDWLQHISKPYLKDQQWRRNPVAKVAATGWLPGIRVLRKEAVNQEKAFSCSQARWSEFSSHFQEGLENAEPQPAWHLR